MKGQSETLHEEGTLTLRRFRDANNGDGELITFGIHDIDWDLGVRPNLAFLALLHKTG